VPVSTDTIVAITGASSGIGAAIARRFARDGARLILIARAKERLVALAGELGNATAHPVDISERVEVEALLEALPTPDIWINNAGIARGQQPLDATAMDDIELVLRTNLMGALYASRIVMGRMRARGTGHIINVTSAAAFNPYKGGNSYAISKAALHMLTQCMRHDLGGTPIRVTEVAPGIVGDTDFSVRRFDGDMSRYERTYAGITPLSSADVAEAVHYCAAAPAHVNIDLVQIFPVQQHGGSGVVHRKRPTDPGPSGPAQE